MQARTVFRMAARATLALAAVAGTTVGLASAANSQTGPPRERPKNVAIADPRARFVPGEVLVRFRDGTDDAARSAAVAAVGAVRRSAIPHVRNVERVRLGRGRTVTGAVAALSRRPEVVYAEPNGIVRMTAMPNDPRFGQLWGLHQASDADIDAPEAWDTTAGSLNVVAAVVDTGMAYDHPDLAPNMWTNPGETGGGKETNGLDDDGNGRVDDHSGWDFVAGDNDPRDQNGHGTHVGGTIGGRGNNAYGVVGVNWAVKLMNLRVLDAGGSGTFADVASAFAYAGSEGANVVNASLGCLGAGCFSQTVKDAIDGAPNTLYVVAAGNDGNDNDATPTYPCNFTSANLICVAATQSNDTRASFSNYGATSVDLAAPGVGIVSTWPSNSVVTLLSDGFETGLANWTSGGPNNTWAATAAVKKSGTMSATDSPSGPYLPNTNSWIRRTSSFSLAGRSGCVTTYALRLDIEDGFDFFDIELSTDGSSWSLVDWWTGSTGGAFFDLQTDLGAFDGQGTVFLRFNVEADNIDEGGPYDGAYVDDWAIKCAGTTYDDDDFNSISGTSMATPHVAGVAALVWSQYPSASVATVRQALFASVDPLASLAGQVATGGRLNAARAVGAICDGQAATLFGTPGNDAALTGTAGNDVIVGLGGNDVIDGAGGNDTICAGAGNDTVQGGAGDDVMRGEAGGDILSFQGSPNAVTASLASGTSAGGGGAGTDNFSGFEHVRGSAHNDTITGDDGANSINALAGNDTLIGGLGNDTLNGDVGSDVINYAGAAAAVTVNLATFSATGAAGSDTIFGGDHVVGSNFNDILTGNAGNNTLNAGAGNDTLSGGLGNDTLKGHTGSDVVTYLDASGAVTVNLATFTATGPIGTDTLYGVDHIVGSNFGDTITGDGFVNSINAKGGDDTIAGGGANDTLKGENGQDTINSADGAAAEIDQIHCGTDPDTVTAHTADNVAADCETVTRV